MSNREERHLAMLKKGTRDYIYVAYGKYGLNSIGYLSPQVLRFSDADSFIKWSEGVEYGQYQVICKSRIRSFTKYSSYLKIDPFSHNYMCWTKHEEHDFDYVTTAFRDGYQPCNMKCNCYPERVFD